MRVSYVLAFDASQHSGIWAGIVGRSTLWAEAGVDVHLIICVPYASQIEQRFHQQGTAAGITLHVLRGRSSFSATGQLRSLLRALLPDVAYMRYNFPYPPLTAVAKDVPTVLEIHADDLLEWRKQDLRKLVVGAPLRKGLLEAAKAYVFVDPDLQSSGRYPTNRKQSVAIPNGALLQPIEERVRPQCLRPKLVLLAGGDQPWQGVDKFHSLAALLPEYDFAVYGAPPPGPSMHNLSMHPATEMNLITEVLATADIGVGSLALERISRPHASPLKVREYLAAGLPTIIAHDDPDLVGCADVLNLGYGFEPEFVAASVRAFVCEWSGRRCLDSTRARVDMRVKEQERLAFLERFSRNPAVQPLT